LDFFLFFFCLEGLEVSNNMVERGPSTQEAYKQQKQEVKEKKE
jgi:hypothetical protein